MPKASNALVERRRRLPRTATCLAMALLALAITGREPKAQNALDIFRPAPAGLPAAVALEIIQDNFDCPSIQNAMRLADGRIVAQCSNGEKFLVARNIAISCSTLAALGLIAIGLVTSCGETLPTQPTLDAPECPPGLTNPPNLVHFFCPPAPAAWQFHKT